MPLRMLRKRAISTPSLRDSPFQGQAGSASLRRASPLPRCLRQFAAAPPRRLCGPSGSRFPTLQCKVPRPRRSADADSLVEPFSGVLVQGISPGPCACCASAPSQPQSAAADSPFQGQAGSGKPSPGVSAASMSATSRCRSAAPLARPLRESLSDFAVRNPGPGRSADADFQNGLSFL